MQNKRTEALFPPLHNNNRFIGASVSSAIIAIRFGSAKRRYISGWLYLAVTILTRTHARTEQRVRQSASQQRCSVVNDAGCRVLVDIFMYCVYKSQGQHWVVVCPIYVHKYMSLSTHSVWSTTTVMVSWWCCCCAAVA